MNRIDIHIDGMHCDGCIRRVRQSLEKAGGVRVESVEIGHAVVDATSNEELESALAVLTKTGYPAHLAPRSASS